MLRSVRRGADGAHHDSLDLDRRSLEEAGETIHDELQVLLDVVVEDLEETVERSTRLALCLGVLDELHDSLCVKCFSK